jgi:membrane protein DedA with SNARE-associated domain
MMVMTQIADALWPDLVNSAPELLIALSARNRYLVLVAGQIDAWAYYLIGTARLMAPDPFLFALGWFYGASALRWMETRTPTVGKIMRSVERYFVRWGHPLVVLFPNNYVCVIAGASRMSPTLFFFLNFTGTVGRLVVVAWVGDIFQGPIDSILGWVADYRIPLLVISITIVAVGALNEARRGRKGMRALEVLEAEDAQDAYEAAVADREDPDDRKPGGSGASTRDTEHGRTMGDPAPPVEGSDSAT